MVAVAAVLTPFGWLAAPLMKMLFDKAHDHLGTDMDEKMKILAATVLPRLSLAIEKAEKSPDKEKVVEWLKRLKGAYYEAEEAIDLFEYEKLKQKVKNDRKNLEQKARNGRGTRISLRSQFVPRPLSTASVKLKDSLSIFSRQKIMLKGCINKLIEIAKEANEFRDLLEVEENASGSYANRETISESPGRVFGREVDKENIVRLLMKNPINSDPGPSTKPAIPIIVITGSSGVGKTTLAQYVYKHMDEQNHFDLLMWVHAPRKFNASDVIKNMIEIIKANKGARNDNPFTSLEALLTQLRSMLGSKKLLLVLDDFWSDTDDFVTQWENFTGCLSNCSPGSKMLLTTQSIIDGKQANLVGVIEVETYYLREIDEDKFFQLFMHYAWPNNSQLQKEEFDELGQKIVVKLKGDPGAAKLVGHQLSGKLDLRHWEKVAEKDWLGDNMKSRIWSYQQLPLDLQRCFAICSLFPKGFQLPSPFLIGLWMSLGFIRQIDKQESLEDIGGNYLHELVSRFFIDEVVDKIKGIVFYKLHDLLRDLAEQVQGDDFIRIDSTNSRKIPFDKSDMLSRSENIRHILLPSSMIDELKEALCLMKNIRTFFVLHNGCLVPKKVLQEILKHMEKLRVLNVFHCVDYLPDFIGNLKHLRYLEFHCSQPIKKLPDSICKLYHLQKLVMQNCESLPNNFSELISLRHIVTCGETMSHISHVGRLTSLQGLDQFVVSKKFGNELHQLEHLNQLRGEMCITGLENVGSTKDAIKANMQNKKHLKALEFEWNSDERDTNNVEGLSTQHIQLLNALQPHPNICFLTLKGFGGERFPNWLQSKNSLKHLRSLTLMDCDKVKEISSIDESLPNCERLILRRFKNLKEMPSLPPNLTYLEIDHIPQLIYFSEVDDLSKKDVSKLVFPSSLTILKISSCSITSDALSTRIQYLVSLSKLELSEIRTITSLPPKEVLCSLKNLKSLIIYHCHVLSSLGGIAAVTSLKELILNFCPNLNPSNQPLPSSLENLNLTKCSNVDVTCAIDVGNLPRLENLYITGWGGRLEGLNSLTELHSLIVSRCPGINPLYPMEKYPFELHNVAVDKLSLLKLILSNESISSIIRLSIFDFQGDSSDDDEVFQYLTSVRELGFFGFNIANHLPKNLKNLPFLECVILDNFPNLCELEQLPRNVLLKITNCPTLTEKLKKGGPYYRVNFLQGSTNVILPPEEESNRF